MEKVIETQSELYGKDKRECPGAKVCNCGIHFEITDLDLEFYEKVSPVFNGKKYNIPSPTLCPSCREQRRMSFRNERNLYKRKCYATGKTIISIYSPDKPYKVYEQSEWWSDRWNPLDYGRDFDFTCSFFQQYNDLMKDVPMPSVVIMNAENSEYTNGGVSNKDCYMLFLSSNNEKCIYSRWIFDSNNLIDCSNVNRSSNSYELVKSSNCHKCFYSKYLEDSTDCYFSYNLKGCNNCILCDNITNQSFCIKNEKVSEDEFNSYINNLNFLDENIKFKTWIKDKMPENINCENCTGDELKDSKNVFEGYRGSDAEDCKYIKDFMGIKDSYDINFQAYDTFLTYDSIGFEKVNSSSWLLLSLGLTKTFYSQYCFNSSDIFGCFGIQNKSYCILNKQYTKEEYDILVPKIIENMEKSGEWGEYFPSSISNFGYNETIASEYYLLSKEEIINKGLKYSEYENPKSEVSKIIPASLLPKNISDIPDDILNWAVECENTNKPFRIIKQELEFYRKFNLPIPRFHPDQRHIQRM